MLSDYVITDHFTVDCKGLEAPYHTVDLGRIHIIFCLTTVRTPKQR